MSARNPMPATAPSAPGAPSWAGLPPVVWVVFIGSYSDRRAAAVFSTETLAVRAAQALAERTSHRDTVEVEAFGVQTGNPGAATFDGGAPVYVKPRETGRAPRD